MSAMLDLDHATTLRREPVDASPPGGTQATRVRVDASQLLLGLSLLLTWGFLYLFILSGLEQAHTQHSLYQELRSDLAEGTAPVGAPITQGRPIALLSIPEIGLDDSVVVEGSRPQQLQQGPGHRLGSVLPGQVGVSVLHGRSLSFGAPFKRIEELTRGDRVSVTTAQGVFTYQVIGVRRAGDPAPPALAAGESRLTLVTASRGLLSASGDVFVDAALTGPPAAAGPVSTPDPDARPMSAGLDVTTLALLALSLQLLLGALAAFVWAWHRWSHRGAWIAVAPCVLGTLWLASSLGARLLPGLV